MILSIKVIKERRRVFIKKQKEKRKKLFIKES